MGRKSNEFSLFSQTGYYCNFVPSVSPFNFIVPLIHTITIGDTTALGVWHITEPAGEMLSLLRLSETDKALVDTFRNEMRKKHALGCRMVLSHLLNANELPLCYDGFGKPFLENSPDHISLSHSGMVSAAIIKRDGPAGIDVETIKERIERVTDRFLVKEESMNIGADHRLEKLHVCWCSKEALYKLNGRPEVDFKNDIFIHPFDYLCSGKGTLTATMTTPEYSRVFRLCYEKLGEYMLVYTC